jgi:ketosteroid isomerase-like protein
VFGRVSCGLISIPGIQRPWVLFSEGDDSVQDEGRSNVVVFAIATAVLGALLLVAPVAAGFWLYRSAASQVRAQRVLEEEARAHQAQAANLAAAAKHAASVATQALDASAAQAQIKALLQSQADAWNEGDVVRFMEAYWRSDELTFSAGGNMTRGWNATLERYRDRYPTREKMGRLNLRDLEVTLLSDTSAMVLGRWNLEREAAPVAGNFTLVLRRFDEGWRIVHDHTSQATAP